MKLYMQSDALKPLAKEWITQIPMGRLAEVTDLEVRVSSNWCSCYNIPHSVCWNRQAQAGLRSSPCGELFHIQEMSLQHRHNSTECFGHLKLLVLKGVSASYGAVG